MKSVLGQRNSVCEGPEMRERLVLGKWKWVNMARIENDKKRLK